MNQPKPSFDPMAATAPYLPYIPWALLLIVAACLAAALHVSRATPLYQARTLLKLSDAARPSNSLAKDGRSLERATANAMETYVEEARSQSVANRTARLLGLASRPEFADLSPLALASTLQDRVDVKNYRSSNLILIQARAEDPQAAADLANAWAESFIQANLEMERKEAGALHTFIQEQLAQVTARLTRSQQMLKNFSVRGGSDHLGLGTRLSGLRAKIADLQAANPGAPSSLPQPQSGEPPAETTLRPSGQGNANWLHMVEEVKALEATTSYLLQKEQEAFIAENVNASNILVVDPAIRPDSPFYPRKRKTVAAAAAAAALFSLGLAWLWLRLHEWVHNEDEAAQATGLPFWGLISDFHLERSHWAWRRIPGAGLLADLFARWRMKLWPPRGEASQALITKERHLNSCYRENYLSLRNKLLLEGQERGCRAISVFSAGHSEGRSVANSNLALALARAGKKVLLVEAHFRRPSLDRLFGFQNQGKRGLAMLLDGDPHLGPHALENPATNLWILPSGMDPGPHPEERLVRERLTSLIEKLKTRFDFVIFDPAPLNPLTETLALAASLDGVILLAAAGRTGIQELKRAAELLKGLPVRTLGCVLNRVDVRYYRRSYSRAYQRSGYGRLVPAN